MEESLQNESAGESIQPNRRRESRRAIHTDVKSDARSADRRTQKPGLAGLIRDMLGINNKKA